jgi:hypothetical protein
MSGGVIGESWLSATIHFSPITFTSLPGKRHFLEFQRFGRP